MANAVTRYQEAIKGLIDEIVEVNQESFRAASRR